jgi:hypothetical protein
MAWCLVKHNDNFTFYLKQFVLIAGFNDPILYISLIVEISTHS